MCALDKSYKGSWIYPKQIVETWAMQEPERSFCAKLIDILRNDIDIDDIVGVVQNAE